jgi:hypothetical protein
MNKNLLLMITFLLILLSIIFLGLTFLSEKGAIGLREAQVLNELQFVRYSGFFMICIGAIAYLMKKIKRLERKE